eukprot:2350829-Prymnesium_polylepis.1
MLRSAKGCSRSLDFWTCGHVYGVTSMGSRLWGHVYYGITSASRPEPRRYSRYSVSGYSCDTAVVYKYT